MLVYVGGVFYLCIIKVINQKNFNMESTNNIKDVLNNIKKSFQEEGVYWEKLFDPEQTHAFYGVSSNRIDEIKLLLKNKGAKKFRVVKNKNNPIICFDASFMGK